jgi:hypothetical protein
LEFGNVDCFITDFIFLILKGTRTKTTFHVEKVINIPIQTKKLKVNELFTKNLLFFYGNLIENIDTSKSEVFLIHPEDKKIRDIAVQKGFRIIERDNFSLNNPVYVQINDKTILLNHTEFFKNKEKGYFLGNKYVKALIRTYISQYDLSPFDVPHMYIDTIPNAFIVFQDSYTFIEKYNDIHFMSLGPFKTNQTYLEYNPSIDMFFLKKK